MAQPRVKKEWAPEPTSEKRYKLCRERTPFLGEPATVSVNSRRQGVPAKEGMGVGTKCFFMHKERLQAEWKGREDFTGLNTSTVPLLGTAHPFTRPRVAAERVPVPLSMGQGG